MTFNRPESEPASSSGLINLQDQYLNSIMDASSSRNPRHIPLVSQGNKLERRKSFTQGHGSRIFRYFTVESLFLLIFLTASLLILPLVLPPLPPPPFMLLMIPICILALLMVLAFMPSNARDARTYL